MNVDTGEIMRLKTILGENGQPEVVDAIPDGFKPVPDDLTEEAEKVLQGRDRAFADMTQKTPLTDWAKSQRRVKNKKRSNLKSMQKASKKRNR